MKVIIMSDSHGKMDNVEKLIKNIGTPDMVIHLGDILGQDEQLKKICGCPAKIVQGNCDFYSENPKEEIITIGENKILATHGHKYGVDWGLDNLAYAAEERGCNIAMYGHTHIPEINYYGGITIVNPGSISQPRQLNRKPTYAIMSIDEQGKANISIQYV
jgi:hypothetical protein